MDTEAEADTLRSEAPAIEMTILNSNGPPIPMPWPQRYTDSERAERENLRRLFLRCFNCRFQRKLPDKES